MKHIKRRQLLSEQGVSRIVRAIEAVDALHQVTWSDIQKIASDHAGEGYTWTRQALERHASIKKAYLSHSAARTKLLKNGPRSGRRLTEPQKMARLEEQVQTLQSTLKDYDELFATYIANAVAHGLTVQQLSAPLQRPSRGSGNSEAT